MYVYHQDSYQQLISEIESRLKDGLNSTIITLPGMGTTFCLKSYLQKNPNPNIKLITAPAESLTQLNIVDLDFYKNSDAVNTVDTYFKIAAPANKFIVIINSPSQLNSPALQRSYFSGHVYKEFYFGPQSSSDIKLLVLGNNASLNSSDIDLIYKYSGGFGQVAKYLAVNNSLLSQEMRDILINDGLKRILEPIVQEIQKCPLALLEKLKVASDGKIISSLISSQILNSGSSIDIKIDFDLSFEENGVMSGDKLTSSERDIINSARDHQGQITKEKISEIKWGDGQYEGFSDQAIKQQILRLNKKLRFYKFGAITGVGYKLAKK